MPELPYIHENHYGPAANHRMRKLITAIEDELASDASSLTQCSVIGDLLTEWHVSEGRTEEGCVPGFMKDLVDGK